MASSQIKHAIGIFLNRQSAVEALQELRDSGFPMHKITVLTKKAGNNEQAENFDTSKQTITPSQGATLGAIRGGVTGGLLALIGGLSVLIVPGFGPAIAAESILVTLLGSGASATAGGLIGALRGWFIPEEQAKLYSDRVSQENYLLTMEGTEDEIGQAETVLGHWGIQEWRVFTPPKA